ncbi:MAG: hypothetical protein ABIT76_06700 [Chthoniobacterales bacterium]
MNWGVIAFIDVLGFKGIWNRGHSADEILSTLETVRKFATELKEQQNQMSGGDLWENLSLDTRMFSDTLVISCHLPQGRIEPDWQEDYESIRRYVLLRYVVLMLSSLVAAAANGECPLLYRGCVATGLFAMNDFAMLGPAVDEAGSFFESADGAFVFLCPSAAKTYEQRPGLLSRATFPYFLEYDVPLKETKTLPTYTINPLLRAPHEMRPDISAALMSTFGPATEIPHALLTKHTNTQRFLHHAQKSLPPSW